MKKILLLLFLINALSAQSNESDRLLKKGWDALIKDNDPAALQDFELAYQAAKNENNQYNSANALLRMGICTYGVSYSQGLHYCLKAMEEFKSLEKTDATKALTGRSKCLQLISTIKSRQNKFKEAITLSREAMKGFPAAMDTSGYLGLIYNSLGTAYEKLNQRDSARYYHYAALHERLITNKFEYLPGSYISVAALEMKLGNKAKSRNYYERALLLSDSTENKQAQVASLVGLGNWELFFNANKKSAETYYSKAKLIASALSDKSFYLTALERMYLLYKQEGKLIESIKLAEEIQNLKDSLSLWERERITKSLEVQFGVAEKERQLGFAQKERDIAILTNYLLWISIGSLTLIALGIIVFLRKISKRDKELLKVKEDLFEASEAQKKAKQQQMQNEIEFKESQLSAMTFQMLQKNELLQELNSKLSENETLQKDVSVNKLINKGLNQDKEWSDFNSHFESINKNFYSRIKQAYPDISPNELKICALIKLNLSIKEMAAILNISPDSVKTARYRLRKKLQLTTEDNLTDFILNLK